MAITVDDSNNRVEDMEGVGPTVSNIGSGGGGSIDNTFFIQGSQAVSRKVTNTSARGMWISGFTAINMSAAGDNRVWLFKGTLLDYVDVNSNGFNAFIASNSATSPSLSDSNEYLLHDNGTQGQGEFQYPILGGWIFQAIDPNVSEWIDVINGTPDLTAIDFFGISAGLTTGVAKSTNIYIDSIDLGDGLYLVGTTPDGTYQDFVDYDLNSKTTGRFGHIRLNGSNIDTGIVVLGKLVIGRNAAGTSTLTDFTDSNKSLRWPGGLVDVGWNKHEFDCATSNTTISLTNCTFIGGGRDNRKIYFDSEREVIGGTTDQINKVGHGFASGDAVTYSNEGGTNLGGLISGTNYFVERIDNNNISLHAISSGRRAAFNGSTPISLTPASAGTGQNHSLIRVPDTRPDIIVTGSAAGASITVTNCLFQRCRNIVLTSAASFDSGTMLGCSQLTLGGAILDGLNILSPTTSEGDIFTSGSIVEIEKITNTTFLQGSTGGHAIEITGSTGTLDISNLTFTSYGPDPENGKGHSFHTQTDVDDINDEIDYVGHNFTTGDPVFYSRHDPSDGTLGTDAIGMSDGDLVYVRSVTANSFSLHPTRFDAENSGTNKINLTDGSTGEIHTFYSADAAIVNNTGGLVTINVTGGNTPTIRNKGTSYTVVVNAVTVEVNGVTEGTRVAIIGNGGAEDGNIIVEGYADSTGTVTGSFSGTTPQGVIIRARNGGIINAAIQDNGGIFTDFTDAARSLTSSPGIGSTNDVDLTPATPAINDAFYFGGLKIFEEICINVTTAGSNYTGSWDYWNGSSWISLTVTDTTSSFQTLGKGEVSFTAPSDWATTNVNSQGPFYYVRFIIDSVSSPIQARGDSITLNKTVKYIPFESSGTIQSGSGLTVTAVWQEDNINP